MASDASQHRCRRNMSAVLGDRSRRSGGAAPSPRPAFGLSRHRSRLAPRRAVPPILHHIAKTLMSAPPIKQTIRAGSTETGDICSVEASVGDARRWLALLVLLAGAFLPGLDFNMVNLARPSSGETLVLHRATMQFVISAYAATYAVFLITGGRLGDWLGRKRMFMLGVAGFTLASVFYGTAWSPSILVTGRSLQGLTATVMAPQVLASIRVMFPVAGQRRALGLYGATFGLANICGQVLGGALVSSQPFGFIWRAVFLINVPIGVAAFIGCLLFLSDSRAPDAEKLDIGGVVLTLTHARPAGLSATRGPGDRMACMHYHDARGIAACADRFHSVRATAFSARRRSPRGACLVP